MTELNPRAAQMPSSCRAAQAAFPVLQDGMHIDLLPWLVVNEVDRTIVDLKGGGRLTFSVTDTANRRGLCIEAFLPCPHPQEALRSLSVPRALPPLASEAGWSATELGLSYAEFVSDDSLALLDDYPALAGFLGSLRRRVSALVDEGLDLADRP